MSVAVIAYQIVIAVIIISSAALRGRNGCITACVIASIWTLTHIFAPWLMFLQFGTVIVATFIGLSIASEPTSDNVPVAQPVPPKIPEVEKSKSSNGGWLFVFVAVMALLLFLSTNEGKKAPVATEILNNAPAISVKPQRSPSYSWVPDYNTTREVQQLLKNLGYEPGQIDGVYGAATRGAVSQYQRDIGLYPDGLMSVALVEDLRSRAGKGRWN